VKRIALFELYLFNIMLINEHDINKQLNQGLSGLESNLQKNIDFKSKRTGIEEDLHSVLPV
jgi:hypothetical protein